jgi:hypothetical protein
VEVWHDMMGRLSVGWDRQYGVNDGLQVVYDRALYEINGFNEIEQHYEIIRAGALHTCRF